MPYRIKTINLDYREIADEKTAEVERLRAALALNADELIRLHGKDCTCTVCDETRAALEVKP